MATTNFPDGVTNAVLGTSLATLTQPDPTQNHTWFDDFDDYTAAQWTITETGTGTRAVGNLDNGILVITNAAANNDANFLQWSGNTNAATVETWKWEATRPMWFKTRFKVSDATASAFVIGLQITDTTPLDTTDGLFFIKAAASTSVVFTAEKGNTASTVTAGTMANDTYVELGFAYLPSNQGVVPGPSLNVFFNGNRVGSLTTFTNFPNTEELTISFGIQNGEAVAKSMSVDYIFVSERRTA
jgi:hypothetical protein